MQMTAAVLRSGADNKGRENWSELWLDGHAE